MQCNIECWTLPNQNRHEHLKGRDVNKMSHKFWEFFMADLAHRCCKLYSLGHFTREIHEQKITDLAYNQLRRHNQPYKFGSWIIVIGSSLMFSTSSSTTCVGIIGIDFISIPTIVQIHFWHK